MNEYDRLYRQAQRYKGLYPKGTRILLLHMGNDPRPVEDDMRGTVIAVDDMFAVHCRFDNGRQLGIIPGEDSFRKLTDEELAEEQADSEDMDDELHPKIQQGVREKASPFGLTFLCCSLHVGKTLHGLGEALEGLVGVTVFNAIADAVLNVSLRHDLSALFLRSPRHRRAQPGKILVKRHQQLEILQDLLRQLRLKDFLVQGQLVGEGDGFFLEPGPQAVLHLSPAAGVAVAAEGEYILLFE